MRNGVLTVSTDDDVGEGMGLKQTHWRPIFLAVLLRGGHRPPRYPGQRND